MTPTERTASLERARLRGPCDWGRCREAAAATVSTRYGELRHMCTTHAAIAVVRHDHDYVQDPS